MDKRNRQRRKKDHQARQPSKSGTNTAMVAQDTSGITSERLTLAALPFDLVFYHIFPFILSTKGKTNSSYHSVNYQVPNFPVGGVKVLKEALVLMNVSRIWS